VIFASLYITDSGDSGIIGGGIYIILRMHNNLRAYRAEQESSNGN